jgi:hypothetical protein
MNEVSAKLIMPGTTSPAMKKKRLVCLNPRGEERGDAARLEP